MVDLGELAIKPEVDVDHRHAHQAIELAEIGQGFPGLRQQQLERVHGHGTHIGIRLNLLGLLALDAANAEARNAAVLGQLDLAQGAIKVHFPAMGPHVIDNRLTEPLRRIAIEEGHLRSIGFLEEPVQGRQHHGAGNFIGVNEIEGLAHG